MYTDMVHIKTPASNVPARLFLFNRCLVVCKDLTSRSVPPFLHDFITNLSSDTGGDGQKRFYQVGKFSTHDLRILDRGGPLNELELNDASWSSKRSRDSASATTQVRKC